MSVVTITKENFESEVLTFLSDNKISHIDYFILTHYDLDHFGNLEKLINENIIDSNTRIYIPKSFCTKFRRK